MDVEFKLTRDQLLGEYKQAGAPFDVSTLPLKSTLPFFFDVVEAHPAAAPTMAHAVLRAGQVQEFFSYGVGDAIPTGFGAINRRSDESDTNLSRARRTIGATDVCVEGISAAKKETLISYASTPEAIADVDVAAAYSGGTPIYDPGALAAPLQVHSPSNLEDALFEAIKTATQVEFEWDRKSVKKIGTLDEIPEGAARSLLKASGIPRNDNRYRVPEGYLWARDTKPGCEFVVRLTVKRAVVVPINLLAGLLGTTAAVDTPPIPTRIVQNLIIRVHGLSVGFPGKQC